MSIHSLEDKSRKELVEIIKIQMEEYRLLQKRLAEVERKRDGMFSLSLTVASEMHRIRNALEFMEENTPESINEKIRIQANRLSDGAKQLRQQLNGSD